MKHHFFVTLALALIASSAWADWQTATVGLGNTIKGVAVDPVRNRIFTANNSSGTVTVVDGQTNATQTWTTGAGPYCLAVNPVTGKLYVSINGSSGNDTVVVFDTLGTVVTRIVVRREPCAMVVDAANNRVYVANNGSDTITLIQADAVARNVGVRNLPNNMAFNTIEGKVYVTYNSGTDSVTVLSEGGTLINHYYSGKIAYDVCVNAAKNMAYVANFGEDSVTVFNCHTNAKIAKVKVGDGPRVVVCNPATSQIYVANYNDGTVSAINGSSNTLRSTATVQSSPMYMAVNSATNMLYVGNGGTAGTPLMILDYSGVKPAPDRDSLVLGHAFSHVAANPVTNKIYAVMECGTHDSLAVIDGGWLDTSVVSASYNTSTATVNPVTGDAYFANFGSSNVTVIKSSGDTATIAVGAGPIATAVNPLTNRVYVCNYGGKSVSVIDGSTYTVDTTIAVDTLPRSIAVNPLTNYIYVGTWLSSGSRIKVIDGKDWDTTSVPVGLRPYAISVNSRTNRIYVGNYNGNTVSVIDGARHTVLATVTAGTAPYAIAVNPVANKIYCANDGSDNVTVIDGATNAAASVTVGDKPDGVTVNTALNRVYISNYNGGTVSEINGATNAVDATITVGTNPHGIDCDPVTGKVFVCNNGSSSVSVIDCGSRSVTTVGAASGPRLLAVDPVTAKVYVACNASPGKVTVIDQVRERDTKLITDVSAEYWSDHTFEAFQPSISGKAVCRFDSTDDISMVLNNVGTAGGPWNATGFTPAGSDSVMWDQTGYWGADSLRFGENFVTYLALEGNAATTNNCGKGTPFGGSVLVYPAYLVDGYAPSVGFIDSLPDDNDQSDGYGPYPVRAVITDFSGIDHANLNYRLLAGKAWPHVTMNRADGDTFVAAIPAQTLAEGDTAEMSYYISAGDHANSMNIFSSGIRTFKLRNLTGVAGNPPEPALPKTYALQAAYPNPSRGRAVIRYQLPKGAAVQLQVYNISGQLVKTISEGRKPAGYHQVNWSNNTLSNGIYFYTLKAGEFAATRKLVVLK